MSETACENLNRMEATGVPRHLSARLEPFDSYWQAPEDIVKGYKSFYQYYKYNFLNHIPAKTDSRILVVSCGPGYFVNLLNDMGYDEVLGIDSDAGKIEHAKKRGINCRVARAFEFLQDKSCIYDAIICEQELNHLTLNEMIDFLAMCRAALTSQGVLVVYGLNGTNPIVGAENLAHNIDHFNTFTEYSLQQVLQLAGFCNIRVFPLRLYVFWKNPMNYIGLLVTGIFSIFFRLCFAVYGKKASIFTKKIGAAANKPPDD